MNDIGKYLLWQKLRDKTNKGEEFTLSEVVWGFLTNGGQIPKDQLIDDSQVKTFEKRLADSTLIASKTKDELKAYYNEQKAAHDKNLQESKDFFKKFQDQCKKIKAEINKKKIEADTKNAVIETLRGFLENLNREIIDETKFPSYEEWEQDTLNVATNQLSWAKDRAKQAKKLFEKNTKWLEKLEAEIPYPVEKNDSNEIAPSCKVG